jgi:riboflavin kinase/FMN adenylyltransferase
VTFDPHPDVVLAPSFQPMAPLTPHPERRARLTAMGVDVYEVIPFTRELAALEPETFCDQFLVGPFEIRDLVVGEGFALGRARSGNLERLRAIGETRGFRVHAVPLLEIDGAPVSSTRIRKLMSEGRVREAARQLGRRYDLGGVVVSGDALGRKLGCPTANLRPHDEKFQPRDGIYAGWARIDSEPEWRPAAASLGVRPTIDGQVRRLEVHLLDWSGDLVGRELDFEFEDWLRPEIKFDSLQALAAAIQDDLVVVREKLARVPAPEPLRS